MGRRGHLGELEELALLAALGLGDEADGASVRTELDRVAGRRVSVSTVYVTLTRLEEKGYVRSRKGAPVSARGGKARRLYTVTAAGRRAAEAARAARDRLWAGIPTGEANV